MKRNLKSIDRPHANKLQKTVLNHIFNNLIVYIISSRFGPGRLKILETQVLNNGGQLHRNEADPKLVTHVITEETFNQGLLLKCCKVQDYPNARFLKCSWMVKCIKSKELKIPNEEDVIYIHSDDDNLRCLQATRSEKVTSTIEDELQNETSDCEVGVISKEVKHENKNVEESINTCISPKRDSTGLLKEKFACSHSSRNPTANPNKFITDELEKLSSAYESKKDTWRAVGYQKAIAAINNHPKEIETWEEARKIRGVGDRLADKIKEILERGELRKVKEVCDNDETKALQLFMGVWGAGATTANKWYFQGFRTLKDLLLKAALTRHQEIGIKYYDEFNERMIRTEVMEIEQKVQEAAKFINSGLEVTVCGSYRRGKSTCGDVDILITHPDGVSQKNVFNSILENLRQSGFITDDLVIQEHNGNQQKYLGVCKLPGEMSKHRRLDIIVVPYKEYAPAIMYFTGSAHFNRSMRLLATKLDMSLSEHGLRKGVVRDEKNSVTGGILLDTPTEESIFSYLGLKYRPPNERNH